jgi:putative flippase GtrA
VFRFVVVGATAAAVHQLVVAGAVELAGLSPGWANLPGFMVAWVVSYLGQRRYTFRSSLPHRHAAPRFLLVSSLSFVANQGLFLLLLLVPWLHYAVALFVTQLVVAVGTYTAVRLWAFSKRGDHD